MHFHEKRIFHLVVSCFCWKQFFFISFLLSSLLLHPNECFQHSFHKNVINLRVIMIIIAIMKRSIFLENSLQTPEIHYSRIKISSSCVSWHITWASWLDLFEHRSNNKKKFFSFFVLCFDVKLKQHKWSIVKWRNKRNSLKSWPLNKHFLVIQFHFVWF